MVAIAQGDAQHVGNAAIVTGSGTHPQDVVVAPLDIKVVVVAQDVHDFIRAGTAVIDVAQEVQHINGQLLNQVTHGDNEFIYTMGRNDGLDNHIDISLLVWVTTMLVQKLLDDIREILGQCLVNLGTAIF